MNASEDKLPDVLSRLGDCLVRIQRYEGLMKSLLASHEVAGLATELEARLEDKKDSFSVLSLGLLVKQLFETYMVCEGFERELLPADAKASVTAIRIGIASRMSMPSNRWHEAKKTIEELVDMRNELIHHFLEKFDLRSDDGKEAALLHLIRFGESINEQHATLARWVTGMNEARHMAAQFMLSPVFEDIFVNGIEPGGTFEWSNSGIVRSLREAANLHAVDGWTKLSAATAWIQQDSPEQKPEKYGCRTWPQVIHDSRQFKMDYRVIDGRRVAGYVQLPLRATAA